MAISVPVERQLSAINGQRCLLKFKHIAFWIASVGDQINRLWRSEIGNLTNLAPSSFDDAGKGAVDILHLKRQVSVTGFIYPRMVAMMSHRMLMNFQKGVFQPRKSKPD